MTSPIKDLNEAAKESEVKGHAPDKDNVKNNAPIIGMIHDNDLMAY